MSNVSSVGKDDIYIKPNSLKTNSAIMGRDASQLTMDDFFNLLVAQMTNQDMLNPTADTEYISQMAQFTTLQGIQTIQEYQLSSYAASYVGKNVAIAYTSDTGSLTKTEGVVTGVTFYDGEPKVVVQGVSYPLYSVMEVKVPGTSSADGKDNMTVTEAATYIGKTVSLTHKDDDDEEIEVEGVVSGINTDKNGVVQVIIDGNEYPASLITAVKS